MSTAIKQPQRREQCEVLYFSWSIKVDIPAASYDVARGDNITIPCTFQSALPVVTTATVEWSRISKDGTKALILMYYWPDKDTDIADEYQNRAVFAGDMSRSIASVNISGISMADNGTIECNVNIKKDVSGKIQDITSLVVLGISALKSIARYPDENVEEKLRTEHGETAHDDQPDEEHERSHPPMLPPNKPKGTVY
ncbi:GPA33 protein, partial [Polypterus senegalus]